MLGFDPLNEQNLLDEATRQGHDYREAGPGLFSGVGAASWKGVASGTAKMAGLFNQSVVAPVSKTLVAPIDALNGNYDMQTWIDDQVKSNRAVVDNLKMDPRTTGIVANVVHGLGEIVPIGAALAVSGGAAGLALLPEATAAVQGNAAVQQGLQDHLDPGTAFGMGAITALSTWAGMKLPMHSSAYLGPLQNTLGVAVKEGLAADVAAGAAANVPLGMVTRGFTAEWLKANGYPDMAEAYKILDKEAIAVDLIMGGGFGALAHYGPKVGERYDAWRKGVGQGILDSDKDAALAMNNLLHLETGIAPGIPADPLTREAHLAAAEGAIKSVLAGEPVKVPEGVTEGNWVEDPSAVRARLSVAQAVAEHMGQDWVDLQHDTHQADIAALKAELEARGMDISMLDLSGPAQERQAAKAAAVQAQPAQVEIPGAVHGNMSEVSVNGVYHPTQWILVDAAQHQATIGKAENQPRDRNRKPSEAQVEKIANAPDIKQLVDSPLMDYGAPTMDRNGNIVGGNGRFEGLSRAYDRGNGPEYLGPLKERLPQFGIDPSAVDGMQKPVLVRVVTSDIKTRKLALASNESSLRMSALELAKTDAERLPDIRGLKFAEDGSIPTAANQTHLRAWLAEFPVTEQAALLDKNGNLSAEGAKRLQSAILYQAFGDSPILERLIEAIDPEVRNAATALTRVAPKIAEAKAAIAAGEMYPLDIAPDLEAAVEQLANLRRSGEKVADFLNQNELFADNQLTAEARKILQFFGENARSPKAMAEMATNFYDQAKAAGNPSQATMFATEPPTKATILDTAIASTGKRLKSGDLFEQVQAADRAAAAQPLEALLPAEQLKRLPPEKQGVLKELYQAAATEKPQFDAINEQIAADVGGHYTAVPLKGAERAIDKIQSDYNGDPTKMKDLLRSTIIVDTAAAAQEAVAQIQSKYQVVGRTRNLFDPAIAPIDGYRDAKLNVVINGHIAEIQVNLPEMAAAKKIMHRQYEEREAITRRAENENRKFTAAELTMIDMLNTEMRAAYEPAWASAMSRLNSSAEMGVPLRRAESEGNLRGGDVSQAAQTGTGPGMFPNETGIPSTSNSSTFGGMINSDTTSSSVRTLKAGAESGKQNPAEKQTLEQIFLDHPDMTVPMETRSGGEPQVVPAAGALEIADANVVKAEADAPAFDAAITCFLRG